MNLGNYDGYIWRNQTGAFTNAMVMSTNYELTNAGANSVPNASAATTAISLDDGAIDLMTGAVGTAPTKRMTIDINGDASFSGNVGIPTSNAGSLLYVEGSDNGAPLGVLSVKNTYTGGSGAPAAYFESGDDTGFGVLAVKHTGTYTGVSSTLWVDNDNTGGGIAKFNSGGSTRFQVNGNGRVGIGTASPTHQLHVAGGDIYIPYPGAGSTDGFRMNLGNWDGYIWRNQTGAFTNDLVISTNYELTDGGADLIPNAGAGTGAITCCGAIKFMTGAVNTPPTTKMQILNTGEVGIGRSPSVNILEVEGAASKTAAGDWLANSDGRLKTDVEEIADGLATIRKLRPISFRYNEEYQKDHPSVGDRVYYNFIAQEYQEIFPESVQDDGTGYLQIDTYSVRPHLVAAVQELDAQMKAVVSENATLKKRNHQLESADAALRQSNEQLKNQVADLSQAVARLEALVLQSVTKEDKPAFAAEMSN